MSFGADATRGRFMGCAPDYIQDNRMHGQTAPNDNIHFALRTNPGVVPQIFGHPSSNSPPFLENKKSGWYGHQSEYPHRDGH